VRATARSAHGHSNSSPRLPSRWWRTARSLARTTSAPWRRLHSSSRADWRLRTWRPTSLIVDGLTSLPTVTKTVHATGIVSALFGDGAPLDLQTIPADLPFDEVILRLEAQRPVAIAAYASMLVRLAEAKSAGLLSIDPFVLSATSEPLDLDMIDAIEQAFEVRPTETFGSSEGVVGPTSLRMGV